MCSMENSMVVSGHQLTQTSAGMPRTKAGTHIQNQSDKSKHMHLYIVDPSSTSSVAEGWPRLAITAACDFFKRRRPHVWGSRFPVPHGSGRPGHRGRRCATPVRVSLGQRPVLMVHNTILKVVSHPPKGEIRYRLSYMSCALGHELR